MEQSFLGHIREFIVAAENGPLLEREDQMLADRDIHFGVVPGGQRSGVLQIKRITVDVLPAILPIEREGNSGTVPHSPVNGLQPAEDLLERDGFKQGKIEILREP